MEDGPASLQPRCPLELPGPADTHPSHLSTFSPQRHTRGSGVVPSYREALRF